MTIGSQVAEDHILLKGASIIAFSISLHHTAQYELDLARYE